MLLHARKPYSGKQVGWASLAAPVGEAGALPRIYHTYKEVVDEHDFY